MGEFLGYLQSYCGVHFLLMPMGDLKPVFQCKEGRIMWKLLGPYSSGTGTHPPSAADLLVPT